MADLPIIPEFITVHLGPPRSNAPNVTVSFPDYIKNVASSEIYPTWPENAIRANIYAQTSYALNRVYTEWYRSQGYDFDITNSTAYDQAFVNGRDIFDNIARIVDEQFNNYLVRPGSVEPFFAQYCNGTTVTCEGLSQWGTVPLAEQGMTPYEILTHFYGDNLNIIRDAPTAPNIPSYPGIPLRIGSSSNEVRELQLRLNRISTNYPAIPKIYPVNGLFDLNTENAVRKFQEIFNLAVDGVVGKATWYRIAYIFSSVKRLSELDSEGLTLQDISKQFPSTLEEGQTGQPIFVLQYILAVVGTFYDQLPIITVDGVFGPNTRAAIEAYQKEFGLPVTGAVDRETWISLYNTYLSVLAAKPEDFSGGTPLYPGVTLTLGSRGESVSDLQTYLNVLSTVYPEIPTLPVTGYYGEQTRAAVTAAQELLGLNPTGSVNAETWALIVEKYEDITRGSQTSPGQFPGYTVQED